MTDIEKLIFRDGSTHAVVGITQSEGRITIGVAPWNLLEAKVTAEFSEAKITSLDVYTALIDELNLPWDIIGFDCYALPNARWRFFLHAGGIEYCWESQWPELLPDDRQQATDCVEDRT